MAHLSRGSRTAVTILSALAGLLAVVAIVMAIVLYAWGRLPSPPSGAAADMAGPDTQTATSAPGTDRQTVTETATQQVQAQAPSTTTSRSYVGGTDNFSTLPCDGRGVLIVASVVDDGSAPVQQRIDDARSSHPGAKSLAPGACGSLRASYNGQKVFPVVVDYGRDTAGLCRAYANAGGDVSVADPRILDNDPTPKNPC